MSNLNKINGSENILQKNDNLTDYKNIFKEKINKLIPENNTFLNIETFIRKSLERGLKLGLEKGNYGIFERYNSLEENELRGELTKKINKYLPIHEQILFKTLNQEVENLEKKDKANIKNVINNTLKKYFYIIFIFSEKIKISDLEKNLSLSLEELSFAFASAKMDIEGLYNFGGEVVEKLKKRFDIKKENKFTANEKFFALMYRRLFKEMEVAGENNDKGIEIGKKIEEEIKKAFGEIFYIFETWVEFGFKDDEKLKNLQIFTRKIIEGILYLKKQNIAFNDFEYKNFNDHENFIKSLEKNILSFLNDKDSEYFKSDYKDDFKLFLASTLQTKESGEQTKKDLIKNLEEKTEKIAKSRIPEKNEYLENLDIKNVDFSAWTKIPENQKYEFVFSEVIAKNGKIQFADFLELKNEEKFEKYFEIYAEYFTPKKGDKNIFKENLKNQFEEVKNLEGISLKEFIENDVNNLNLLILWWRFILKIRFLEKNNLEINLENILNNENLAEKEYGVVEKISEKLNEKNIDISKNIIFSIDGKVRNTSSEKDYIGLEELIKSLKKGIIDLSKEKIQLTNNEEKIIGSIQDLYIPIGLTGKKDSTMKRDISAIDTHLDNGIDFCYRILQGQEILKNSAEETYGKILQSNNIINSLNSEEISVKQKEELQKLVEVLKFIKNRISLLENMMITAQEDKEKLEKNKELKNLLSKHIKSNFGPAKAFNRAFIKLIGEYGGNFNKLGDLTRARVVSKDLDENIERVIDFIEASVNDKNITNVSVVDSTGEPISIPKKPSGYRDIKIFVKLKSGNTMEVQFQVEDMYEVKDIGLDLEKDENNKIFEKMKKEGAGLTEKNLKELLDFSKERNIKLPTKNILEKMMIEDSSNIDWKNYENILTEKNITTDYSYAIVRQLDKNSPVGKKLTRLERILADSAWSKIVLKYLKNKNIQVD